MSFIDNRGFRKAAAQVKRSADPDAWENFMGALEAYTWSRVADVVTADPQTVGIAQGIARDAQQILLLLKECDVEPKPQGENNANI